MSQEVKQIRIQQKVDSQFNWEQNNPRLENKEIGYERETGKYKIGDGIHNWNDLEYAFGEKVDRVEGKGLSTNDFTNDYKSKVDNTESLINEKLANIPNQKGEGNYSNQMGYNTQAVGHYTTAEGYNTIAGIKGYFFQNIEFGPEIFNEDGISTKTYGPCTITLTKEQPDDITLAPIPETFEIGFAVGDELTLINDSKYPRCCKITEVTDNIITVDALPFNTIKNIGENIGCDDYQVICPDKPLAGDLPLGYYAHVEGEGSWALERASHAEGRKTRAEGQYSHAEGRETKAGYASHAEGIKTEAGDHSHAEGVDTKSLGGEGSHSEGKWTKALGNASHAEGKYAQATAETAHAEGLYGIAGARGSHTEGYYNNIAKGADFAHAENYRNEITEAGLYAHAEGEDTVVKAKGAHTEGWNTIAAREYQHVQGKYNKYQDDDGNPLDYADIVGNGSSEEDRSNAYTLDWEGNAWFAGDVKVGSKNEKLITEAEADNKINSKIEDFITCGIDDLKAGVSELETGKLYFVYE